MAEHYQIILEKLEAILATEGAEISALLKILSTQEKLKLLNYFAHSDKEVHQQNLEDLSIKFFALNALYIYIKDNPALEQKLQNQNVSLDKLAYKIYELVSIINQLDPTIQHCFYQVAYAVLADKMTLLTKDILPEFESSFANEVLNYFIKIAFGLHNNRDVTEHTTMYKNLQQQFQSQQQPEKITTQKQVIDIIAFSNLVSIAGQLQSYLLTGEGANMTTQINIYTANAIKIFHKVGDKDWELMCSLLRFYLQKLYNNSIWTYANRLPFFKDFVQNQIDKGSFLFSLFPTQKAALQDILSSVKSTVISMPTSAGKTLLAELKILYTRSLYPTNCLCVYVVPTNALVNQTLKKLKTSFVDLKIEQLLPYNHFDQIEQHLIGDNPDILVCTPEKLNFLLKNTEADFINDLRLIVVDEAHNISDAKRGSIWEFLLANLKQNDQQLSYLLLTPFIRNKQTLAQWLGNDSTISKSFEWSPTKQYVAYHSLHSNKTVSKINYLPNARNTIIKDPVVIDLSINPQNKKAALNETSVNDVVRNCILIEKYTKQQGCILILHRGIVSVEKLAEKLAQNFSFAPDSKKLEYAKELIQLELGVNHPLLELLDKGIAFHHSRLSPLAKDAIENLVLNNNIKILVATTTLAQGMNFPIKTVIFETLNLGGGSNSRRLSYSDFWNIAGRAGRAYKDTEGHIVLGWRNSINETKHNLEQYIQADTTDIISSLKAFFDDISSDTQIDYQFIKDKPIAQNFLHYLNHLLHVSHQYKLSEVTRQDITNILANTLFFKQNEFTEGFLETQDKVVNFSNQYIKLLKNKEVKSLKLADNLGITDISLATIIGITTDSRPLLTECIEQKNTAKLAQILAAIHKIPELKISLGRDQGEFNATLIANILLDWVNGKSIKTISLNNELTVNACAGYLFSNFKNYVPWGMAIYQKISYDNNPILPSYAYYGVNNEESVKLSYIGVPRFALQQVKNSITDPKIYQNISELRQFLKQKKTFLEKNFNKNAILNQIIQNSIL